MDVFKIDQSLSAGLGSAPAPDTLTPEVSFDAGSEFNLSFFDGPEENSTQGFSDPGSVGSASASPPPGTPATIPVNPSNAALPIVQVPPGIVIKQGLFFISFFSFSFLFFSISLISLFTLPLFTSCWIFFLVQFSLIRSFFFFSFSICDRFGDFFFHISCIVREKKLSSDTIVSLNGKWAKGKEINWFISTIFNEDSLIESNLDYYSWILFKYTIQDCRTLSKLWYMENIFFSNFKYLFYTTVIRYIYFRIINLQTRIE